MTHPFGQTCPTCKQRPAIRTDGLCAGCGEKKDTRPELCWDTVTVIRRLRFDKTLRRVLDHSVECVRESVRPQK